MSKTKIDTLKSKLNISLDTSHAEHFDAILAALEEDTIDQLIANNFSLSDLFAIYASVQSSPSRFASDDEYYKPIPQDIINSLVIMQLNQLVSEDIPGRIADEWDGF